MSSKRKPNAPIRHPGDRPEIGNSMATAFGGNFQLDFYHSPVVSGSGSDKKPYHHYGVSDLIGVSEDDLISTTSPAGSENLNTIDNAPASPNTSGRRTASDNNNIQLDNRVIGQTGKGYGKKRSASADDDDNGDDGVVGSKRRDGQDDDDVMESVKAAIGSASSVDDKQRLLSVMISQLQSLKENLVVQQQQHNGVRYI